MLQPIPPFWTLVMMERERDWEPEPHDLEQAVQAFQECSQSMEQGWVLQFWAPRIVGQRRPP